MPKPALAASLLSLLPILGCASPDNTVAGMVTVNDRPLQKGHITLFPVESVKATRGAAVSDGRFEVVGLTPGKYRVVIRATPDVQPRFAANGVATLKFPGSQKEISAKAKGNGQVIDVQPGKQTFDFAITDSK